MPIYEYVCTRCGYEFELIQGFSDKPAARCERCGGKVRKLVSQSAFHLKGSGWYVTDYSSSKRPGSKPAAKTESEAKPSGEGPTGGSSDSAGSSSGSTKSNAKKAD